MRAYQLRSGFWAFPPSASQLKMDLNVRCSLEAQCLPLRMVDDTLDDCPSLVDGYAKVTTSNMVRMTTRKGFETNLASEV